MAVLDASRLTFLNLAEKPSLGSFQDAVREGLSTQPKSIPSRFFYDRRGSELFEAITKLPEYYLTRSELALLSKNADEIISRSGARPMLVEFGSGSGAKTRVLIEAALRAAPSARYVPIDISRDFLRQSSELLLARYPLLEITAIAGEYSDAIAAIPASTGPRLLQFMGSNIGNFTPEEADAFLSSVAHVMAPQDRLLLGLDMKKSRNVIEAAYNDREGITAQFNKNMLARINRDLGGNFDLSSFEHHAPYAKGRIEMRLRSLASQKVRIAALDQTWTFANGEELLTEYSHKYTWRDVAGMAARSGLRVVKHWEHPTFRFALVMLQGASP